MFEFDHAKSEANRLKPGIDFEEAQALWLDDNGIHITTDYLPEQRHLLVARWDGRTWTAVYPIRDAVTRIISVRRSLVKEVKAYETQSDQR